MRDNLFQIVVIFADNADTKRKDTDVIIVFFNSFLKSYSIVGDKKIYYKLSDYDTVKGIVGHYNKNKYSLLNYEVI